MRQAIHQVAFWIQFGIPASPILILSVLAQLAAASLAAALFPVAWMQDCCLACQHGGTSCQSTTVEMYYRGHLLAPSLTNMEDEDALVTYALSPRGLGASGKALGHWSSLLARSPPVYRRRMVHGELPPHLCGWIQRVRHAARVSLNNLCMPLESLTCFIRRRILRSVRLLFLPGGLLSWFRSCQAPFVIRT